MMLIDLNQEIISRLTKTELSIIKFINQHEDDLSNLSIVEIAMDTYSSPASVSRAIRKCGVNGFNELRYKMVLKDKNQDVQNIGEIINKSLIEAQKVIEQLSIRNVLDIITSLKKAKRIYVLARGLTEYVGKEFAFKLQLLDFNVVFLDDPNIMIKITENIQEDECVFVFSLNGKTKELVTSAQNANYRGATVISACCNDQSELMTLSNYTVLGYSHAHKAITEYEVTSRISLNIIARIIIDYIAIY